MSQIGAVGVWLMWVWVCAMVCACVCCTAIDSPILIAYVAETARDPEMVGDGGYDKSYLIRGAPTLPLA